MDNKITYILHKISEGFIVTSNEEYKTNDIILAKDYSGIALVGEHMKGYIKAVELHNKIDLAIAYHQQTDWVKVVAKQPQIDATKLNEDDQREIGYFNLIKLAENHSAFHEGDWVGGFEKAVELLSDRFTIDDISKIFVGETSSGGLFDVFLDYRISTGEKITFKEWYLKHSSPKNKIRSWKVEGHFHNDKFVITCLKK